MPKTFSELSRNYQFPSDFQFSLMFYLSDFVFLLVHASLTHSLVSVGLPLQLPPDVHLLVRLSVPFPHVTEHDQDSHDDQTVNNS